MFGVSYLALSTFILLVLLKIAILFDVLKGKAKKFPLPPGPIRIPIFGYMPFMAKSPQAALKTLADKYGNVFSFHLGNYRIVVLNDSQVIRDAFRDDAFCGRPDLKMLEVRNNGVRQGLVCSEGKTWAEQRKFTVRQLKELGLGKETTELFVHEEIDELVEGLIRDSETPVDLQTRITTAVLNVIWRITCGQRYKHDDEFMQVMLKKTGADLADTQYTGPLLFLPWLINVAPGLTRWKEFATSIQDVHQFLYSIIQEHKGTFDSSNRRDFIDSYLLEIQKTCDPSSSFFKQKGEHSLLVVLLDLFMAGADTTSTTLYWAFLYMVMYPEVQGKIHKEIDEIIGSHTVVLEYRKRMPYTEATMMEILRKSSLVPLGLFHSVTQDTTLNGYHIPKDTVVAANIHYVLNDEKIWGDPHNFRPDRFLDSNNQVIKFDALIPFSAGKRACPGESLAKEEFFLFFVGLLQKFEFVAHPSKGRPSDVPKVGIILSPEKYFIQPNLRKPLLTPTLDCNHN